MEFKVKQYRYSLGEHKDKAVIWIHFPKDKELITHLRKHIKVRWSATQKCWYARDIKYYRELFGLPPQYISKAALAKIHPINREEYKQYLEHLILKGYSENTINTYTIEFVQLLHILKGFSVRELTPERLRAYMLYCTQKLKLSESQLLSRLNAIKFYFEQVLKREKFFVAIPRPKRKSSLPKVLTKKEVNKLFEVTKNLKHLLILKLCYGMGLRVSEVVELKIEDFDGQRMLVLIRQAKGKKDRYVPLPKSVLSDLREYYKAYQPKDYLFEGQYGGQYSIRSAQAVFKNAMKKANINKRIGVHSLRHSYATHLLEYGTDMVFIQKLLGHSNIKTTEIYAHISATHLSKIRSPLDRT